jgi:hypothetical protein
MSRKKKNKREKRKRGRPLRPRLPSLPPNTVIVPTPPGGEKMSEVLEAFIAPYADTWNTRDQLVMLLNLAVIAWNAALVPSSKRASLFSDLLATIPPRDAITMKAILDGLIQRKLTHFPENKRFIFSFDVTTQPDGGFYIMVASTVSPG